MSVKLVNGDLLSADVGIICQQVNCRSKTGTGIARKISEKYPMAEKLYHMFCLSHKNPKSMLGAIQVISLPQKTIVNMFNQLDYKNKTGSGETDYGALCTSLIEINKRFAGKRVGFPYGMGCGLTGEEWDQAYAYMQSLLSDIDAEIYIAMQK